MLCHVSECQTGCTMCDTNGAGKCDATINCPDGYVLDGDTCAREY